MGKVSRMRAIGPIAAALLVIAGAASAQPEYYMVGGLGYMSVLGGAAVAEDRDPGWDFYGGDNDPNPADADGPLTNHP